MFHKPSILIALFGMILGVFIAIIFGVNEDLFKNQIKQDILVSKHYQSAQLRGDSESYLKKEAGKNWRYYQRFHFHSTGIASMSLVLLVLLGFSSVKENRRKIISYILSISGFLYPFVWLFAGCFGPGMGRSLAKEKFAFFGYMGGVYFIAMIVVFYVLAKFRVSLEREN